MAASLPHGDPDPGKSPEAGLTRLLAMCDEAKALASLDWATHGNLDSKAALQAVEQLSRSIAAIQAGVLAGAQASGMWALDGQRNFDSWVTSHTGTTRGTAGRAVKLSNTLQEDLPGTRRALANGDISTDHAQIIARKCAASAKQKEKLADPRRGEAYLLEKAKEMDAGQFAKVAAAWSIEVDPKTADRQWRRQSATQEFSLVPTEEGYVASGSFTLVSGALLKEALAAHMGRKAKDDQRSFTERQADAMVALAGQSLDAGIQMPTARVRPHLIVTMEYDTIERLIDASGPLIPEAFGRGEAAAGEPPGCANEADWAEAWRPGQDHTISTALDYSALEGVKPARLADGSPLPHGVLAHLACNSLFSRVIFGPQSVVLNAGREQRIFTAGQTRAIIARDHTCRYPGCDEGPGFGEIHHSISWAKHKGNTDVDLGILLCYHHHDLVHQREIAITRHRGTWVFTDRRGNVIAPPGHQLPNRADRGFGAEGAPGRGIATADHRARGPRRSRRPPERARETADPPSLGSRRPPTNPAPGARRRPRPAPEQSAELF